MSAHELKAIQSLDENTRVKFLLFGLFFGRSFAMYLRLLLNSYTPELVLRSQQTLGLSLQRHVSPFLAGINLCGLRLGNGFLATISKYEQLKKKYTRFHQN